MNIHSNFKRIYDEDGFCIIKKFFSKTEIKELNYKIKHFLKNKSKNLKGKDINRINNKIINTMHDIDKHDSFFKKFSKKKCILDTAKILLNSTPHFRKCEMFAKPAKIGLSSPFHQDNYLWAVKNQNGLTFWVALDHCNKKNGGLTYYSSSHKFGLLEHEDSYAPGTSQKIKNRILKYKLKKSKKITPKLNPGDVLIHHCMIVHGSNINKSNKSRRGFTIQFKDKKSGYDLNLLKHYKQRLKHQLKSRNQI